MRNLIKQRIIFFQTQISFLGLQVIGTKKLVKILKRENPGKDLLKFIPRRPEKVSMNKRKRYISDGLRKLENLFTRKISCLFTL